MASSNARVASPTARAATLTRPTSIPSITWWNPRPSSPPRRLAAGTRWSSNTSSVVSTPWYPIFSMFGGTVMPSNRSAPDGLDVGARARLGHRQRRPQLTGGHPGEPPLLLLVGAVPRQQVHAHEVGVEDARQRHPAARQLADHQRVGHQVHAGAAELIGNREAEQSHLFHPLDDLLRELVAVLELFGDRVDLLLDQVADGGNHGLLLVGQLDDAHVPSHSARNSAQVFRTSRPAARPRAASCSAIFRLASSIISFPNITAPTPSTSVACRYASSTASALSNSSWVGVNTSLSTSTCPGCSAHFPS